MSASIPSWAVRGQRVVCVPNYAAQGGRKRRVPSANYPLAGEIYTIRQVVFHSRTAEPLLLLEEVVNGTATEHGLGIGPEPGFAVYHFKPLAEPRADNEIETQLYRAKARKSKAPVRESERA